MQEKRQKKVHGIVASIVFFLRFESSPSQLGRIGNGPIVSNLILTTSPLMVADLIGQNSSLPEFSVLSPSIEAAVQHKPSGTVSKQAFGV